MSTVPHTIPQTPELRLKAASELAIDNDHLPHHIAIIMDGNGRWALSRGLHRIEGHRAGADSVRKTITEAGRLGIEFLTLYSFSLENWKRPSEEVSALMTLAVEHLIGERDELLRNNVRLLQIGQRDPLPEDLLNELDTTVAATADCTGLTVVLALNYGSRAEITDAVKDIAIRVRTGEINPENINETTIENHLYTRGLPDPDLLIRTAGERRLSNYLLWQLSYAEIYVTDVLWPDFDELQLRTAILDYAGRNRRFGALDESNS